MSAFINTNTASLNAQRNLNTSQSSLTTSLQRLSSGLRINSAKDDAAGLAISERFTTQIRGISQAARNANDGISLAQTAEGTLGEIGNNLQRMRELAVQSRNSTNSTDDRAALDTEVQQLKAEIGRVAGQANFNGSKLLDGSFTNKTFQVGANQGETISIPSIVNANTSKLGKWTAPAAAAAAATAVPVGVAGAAATSGAGTIGLAGVTAPGAGAEITGSTISLDGGTTTIAIPDTTSGTLGTPADAQDEYLSNVATAINNAVTAGTAPAGLSATYDAAAKTITFANSDTTAVNLTGTDLAGTTAITAGTAAGASTFAAMTGAAGEFSINGTNVKVGAATSAGARVDDLVSAINSQVSGVTASKNATSGALELTSDAAITVAGTRTVAETGLANATSALVVPTETEGFANENVKDAASADKMILAMDAALKDVNSARAGLGAVQNRFSSVIANLQTTSENLSASRSRIQDTDFASETASLTRGQILQQAGTAMLAQANSLPNGVLALLRG